MKKLMILFILLLVMGCSGDKFEVIEVRQVIEGVDTIRDGSSITDIKTTTYYAGEQVYTARGINYVSIWAKNKSNSRSYDDIYAQYIIYKVFPCSTVVETTACYQQKECK